MTEGEKSLAQLRAQRQCFVQKAIEEGAHEAIGEKTVNIGIAATFGPSLEEISDSYYETRANASLHYRGFIKKLWDNSSEQTRSAHTLEDLLARKPWSRKSRKRSPGWRTDRGRLDSAIKKNKSEIEQIAKEDDDEKIQKMLDEFPYSVILWNMAENKKRKKRKTPRVFTSIGKITSSIYHHSPNRTFLFAQVLKENGIPYRKMRKDFGKYHIANHVLLEKHRDRALAAWEKDPELERFKINLISVVCGSTNADVPTTTQLSGSEDYRSVSLVLSDLGIQIPPQQQIKFRKWLFEDCPITVWAYRDGRYIASSEADQFRQYFLEKSKQLLKRVREKT
ncbi:MAG: hypothetical protein M1372_01560 [Patescibacteria group bacterium]|nr:hypothetical protein [Patescibacteria group bacterium]